MKGEKAAYQWYEQHTSTHSCHHCQYPQEEGKDEQYYGSDPPSCRFEHITKPPLFIACITASTLVYTYLLKSI